MFTFESDNYRDTRHKNFIHASVVGTRDAGKGLQLDKSIIACVMGLL